MVQNSVGHPDLQDPLAVVVNLQVAHRADGQASQAQAEAEPFVAREEGQVVEHYPVPCVRWRRRYWP